VTLDDGRSPCPACAMDFSAANFAAHVERHRTEDELPPSPWWREVQWLKFEGDGGWSWEGR
jgi:hypothetical protein